MVQNKYTDNAQDKRKISKHTKETKNSSKKKENIMCETVRQLRKTIKASILACICVKLPSTIIIIHIIYFTSFSSFSSMLIFCYQFVFQSFSLQAINFPNGTTELPVRIQQSKETA